MALVTQGIRLNPATHTCWRDPWPRVARDQGGADLPDARAPARVHQQRAGPSRKVYAALRAAAYTEGVGPLFRAVEEGVYTLWAGCVG